MTEIKGKCPINYGATLFLGSGGYVTCSYVNCPNPSAACDLLLDHAYPWHVVVLDAGYFTVEHPLRERLNGELFDCGLHQFLKELTGPPRQPGRYRVHGDAVPFAWEEVRG
jgi:hypothetical protein